MSENESDPEASSKVGISERNCPMCGAKVPDGFANCQAVFDAILTQEYTDPAFAAVHLLTVDSYVLQHSEEHGPRSNAFHLMRLCLLLEHGGNPSIGQRPPREVGKAFEERYKALPYLAPPVDRGGITIAEVYGAREPGEHAERVRAWAQAVWEAYSRHHAWARSAVSVAGGDS